MNFAGQVPEWSVSPVAGTRPAIFPPLFFAPSLFTSFVTITYTKLTWQTYQASNCFGRFSWQISKYLLPLESGNLKLEQTKFPVCLVFWQSVQIPRVFLDREFIWTFSLFSLCSGYPDIFKLKKIYIIQIKRNDIERIE